MNNFNDSFLFIHFISVASGKHRPRPGNAVPHISGIAAHLTSRLDLGHMKSRSLDAGPRAWPSAIHPHTNSPYADGWLRNPLWSERFGCALSRELVKYLFTVQHGGWGFLGFLPFDTITALRGFRSWPECLWSLYVICRSLSLSLSSLFISFESD